jgi:hypothetical protein
VRGVVVLSTETMDRNKVLWIPILILGGYFLSYGVLSRDAAIVSVEHKTIRSKKHR